MAVTQGVKAVGKGKRKVIIIALICFLAGVNAALARRSHSDCETPRGHFLRTCHCHPKYDGFARYRARLTGPFETEYDVEKWEQALRQGVATKPFETFPLGPDGSRIPCLEAGTGRHIDRRPSARCGIPGLSAPKRSAARNGYRDVEPGQRAVEVATGNRVRGRRRCAEGRYGPRA